MTYNQSMSEKKQNNKRLDVSEKKLVFLKQRKGIAFKKNMKKQEEVIYQERLRELSEVKKLTNFFHEVSKDPAKYSLIGGSK